MARPAGMSSVRLWWAAAWLELVWVANGDGYRLREVAEVARRYHLRSFDSRRDGGLSLPKGSHGFLLDGGVFGCCSYDHDRDAALIRRNVQAGDGRHDQEISQKGKPANEHEQIAQGHW